MQIKMTENGVELIAETDYERRCLNHLNHLTGPVSIGYEDGWNKTGNLIIEGQSKGWTDSPGNR